MTGALEGLRVLDLSQVLAGPFCTMLLGDMGADVVKVELPGRGDISRNMAPVTEGGESGAFLTVNRNKRGIALDLKAEAGRDAFLRLADRADVVVQNYRPGVAERLRVDHAALRARNPRLVYCSISGFGQTGPYAARGGFDLIAQGMSGLMSITGEPGGNPVKCGVPITDLAAGLFAVYGVLAALHHRERTGEGQHVDTSLFEAGLGLEVWEATEYFYTGVVPQPTGSGHRLGAPYQAFRTADGYLTLGADSERHWPRLCALLDLGELVDDPRFRTNPDRLANLPELTKRIEARTALRPTDEWLAELEAVGIPAGPINTVPAALDDPQARARGMVVDVDHPAAGPTRTLGPVVKLSETPAGVRRAAPMLGEHTDEVLREAGIAPADLAALRAEGVVA